MYEHVSRIYKLYEAYINPYWIVIYNLFNLQNLNLKRNFNSKRNYTTRSKFILMYFHKVAYKIARRTFETYVLNLINRCEREPAMNDHQRDRILT